MSDSHKLKCYACGGTGVNPASDNVNWLPCMTCEGARFHDWRPPLTGEAHTELARKLQDLERWKAEMMQVESQWDCQAVGKLLGATLGDHIRPMIEPKVRELIAQRTQARLIMEVALLRLSRWSLRLGENHKMPRTGEYPPAVQSVMDKMRDFLGTDKPASMDVLIHELANAFLAWPLPASVRADAICMEPNYPNRIGTHLLTYTEARQMFQDILLPKI